MLARTFSLASLSISACLRSASLLFLVFSALLLCVSASTRFSSAACILILLSIRFSVLASISFMSLIRDTSIGYCGTAATVSALSMPLLHLKLNCAVVISVSWPLPEYTCISHSTMPGDTDEAKRAIVISLLFVPPTLTPPPASPLSWHTVVPSDFENSAITLHPVRSTGAPSLFSVILSTLPVSPSTTVNSRLDMLLAISSDTPNSFFTLTVVLSPMIRSSCLWIWKRLYPLS